MDDVVGRLHEVFEVTKDSHLAEKLGLSRNTIAGWRMRGEVPKRVLIDVTEREHVNVYWLLNGTGERWLPSKAVRAQTAMLEDALLNDPAAPARRKALAHEVDDSVAEGMVRVPLYDLRASAGGGAITAEHPELLRNFDLPEWWLRDIVHVAPPAVLVLIVWGDSMKPDVQPGDLLVVDTRHNAVRADALYVFEMDGGVFIKKLQRLPGGVLKVISANAEYESYTVKPADDPTFKVVGRVAFHGKVM